MSKPRFANKWYQTPPVNELRQEIQNVYTTFLPAIYGAAESTDSDGNPTPNTTDFPPAKYDEGTLFFATSYPTGVDGGSMQFQQVSGAWVWKWGEFVGASGNDKYRRDASGSQAAWGEREENLDISNSANMSGSLFRSNIVDFTLTPPVTFVGTPSTKVSYRSGSTFRPDIWLSIVTTTSVVLVSPTSRTGVNLFLNWLLEGKWKE
jgi:hypothetical protein